MKLMNLIFLIVFISSSITYSQSSVSMRVTVGAAHLPMSEWKSQFGKTYFPTDKYINQNPTIYNGVSVLYNLNQKHSFSIQIEMLQPVVRWVGAIPLQNQTLDTLGFQPLRIDWKFKAIPITIGYEFHSGYLKDKFEPVLGFGVSYFISELKSSLAAMTDPHTELTGGGNRTGKGFGLQTSLGFQNTINKHFHSVWQARYRYSDGMAFTEHSGDIKIKFTGFDFSIGLEYGI